MSLMFIKPGFSDGEFHVSLEKKIEKEGKEVLVKPVWVLKPQQIGEIVTFKCDGLEQADIEAILIEKYPESFIAG